jgi:signal transduction histidine kinase
MPPSAPTCPAPAPATDDRPLHPFLAALGPTSTLADLPAHDYQVPASTPGQQVADAFKRWPDLPGVVVTFGDGYLELISQTNFFKLMSRPFSLEIYCKRPVGLMLEALDQPSLQLEHGTDLAEAARLALNRRADCVYDPILVHHADGSARILDIHLLLLAQAQLLRAAQVALVQTEKLASLGQLAAGVAHEVNNPLAYVLNNVNVLRRDVLALLPLLEAYRRPDGAEAAAALEDELDLAYLVPNLTRLFDKTHEGLHRVRDIVQNLRDFARLDNADFCEADLNASVLSTLEFLGHEIKRRGVRVETHLGELPRVPCQPRKMHQVFINLVMNAVQACGERGLVTLRTRPEQGAVCVEVEDNGTGIAPEHLPRIFDPFFTTKPVGQGTGLGLSVSYGIIRDHGGSIHVESEPGRGSVFRVRIPRPA